MELLIFAAAESGAALLLPWPFLCGDSHHPSPPQNKNNPRHFSEAPATPEPFLKRLLLFALTRPPRAAAPLLCSNPANLGWQEFPIQIQLAQRFHFITYIIQQLNPNRLRGVPR